MSDVHQRVLAEVRPVADAFIEAGYSVYLVGGAVRDLVVGSLRNDVDLDLTTDARPSEIRAVLEPVAEAIWAQGEAFGTVGARVQGREYEITTHRAEWYSHESRKPEVTFGDDVEVDLSRRDFTVNAMAMALPDGTLIDPFDGRGDLERKVLTTPIEPAVSFADDPLRILRAARFIARYGLQPSAGVVESALALVGRLEIVSAERIRAELDKLLAAAEPGAGLAFYEEVGALGAVFGDHAPVIDELARRLDRSAVDTVLRRTLLFGHLDPDERGPRFRALRYSNDEQRQLRTILRGVDVAGEVADPASHWTDEAIRRWIDLVGFDDVPVALDHLDVVGARGADRLRERIAQLGTGEDLSSFAPVVSGEQVMTALGLPQGPIVGRAIDALRQRRLRDGPASAEDELAYLRTLDIGPD